MGLLQLQVHSIGTDGETRISHSLGDSDIIILIFLNLVLLKILPENQLSLGEQTGYPSYPSSNFETWDPSYDENQYARVFLSFLLF